jgi:signal transduction histidine kinase/CheY-like chemotaxis protein
MRALADLDATQAPETSNVRSRLFGKYVALFGVVVCVALLGSLIEIGFSFREHKTALTRLGQEQADAAAGKIGQFIAEVESQVGWMTLLPSSADTIELRYLDAQRLLRQVPAITELTQLDPTGHEQLRVSRLTTDAVGSGLDLSHEPKFTEAMAHKVYYGPLYFRRESEPYMTLALAGARRDAGVSIAEVNLKLIWDVVSKIGVGERGHAYVVDAQGRLIAHPDISLVLRNIDMIRLPQVRGALRGEGGNSIEQVQVVTDIEGRQVLTAYAPVPSLGWMVFIETAAEEAYAPLYASIERTGLVLLGALALALLAGTVLARKMVVPIQTLRAGAARIGSGDLGQRILIRTGDELEALGNQFNRMAAQIQDSYTTLERKVEERTHQLELANVAKSRFIAAASHDLRQPLHALGLFIAQLHNSADSADRDRVVERIDDVVAELNELFNALLDISRLDAGVLAAELTEFPIAHLLRRVETTFAQATLEKGLRLRVARSGAWVRSDFILLERILINLVCNAVRYTSQGGVVVGSRRRGDMLRIEVWDSGPGIPEDQRRNIFDEFYQLADPKRGQHGGLGLGLAIVDRLCRVLNHPIELNSVLGMGSRFTIIVPMVAARAKVLELPSSPQATMDSARGKLVVVIDDDELVLEAMGGLFRAWGCRVVAAGSHGAALSDLIGHGQRPDLVISDYHLSDGKTGIEVIECLREAFRASIPAFLISGDTTPERLRQARSSGYQLLHKPVGPVILRAMLDQLLNTHDNADDSMKPEPSAAG